MRSPSQYAVRPSMRALERGRARGALSERITFATATVATLALVLLWLLPANAQVEVGDNTNLNLSGDISTGYSGGSGDNGSSHALTVGGNATLHGYYYNPQFINFDFQPYYNRSQANSTFQSITNTSGFIGSMNFFSGSHFPGSFSYAKTFDSTGQFTIPGATGLNTEGSGQTINIAWSELIPDLPSLRATYTVSGNDVSIPGAEGNSHLGSRILNLNSDYDLSGFNLRGTYTNIHSNSEFPQFLSSGLISNLNGDSSSITGMVSHKIPLRGYWTAQATHSGFSSEYSTGGGNGSSDGSNTGLSTTVTMIPAQNLGIGFSAERQSNLFGALQQQIVQAGGVNPLRTSATTGSESSVGASATYTLSRYLYLNGQVVHRDQEFEGLSLGITQYGGGVTLNFSRRLLGAISFAVGANDTASQEGNSGLGLYTIANFSRKFQRWDIGANFSYNQSVQTLLVNYTTSMYGYGTTLRRKIGEATYWGATFNGSHSGLEQIAGSTSHSESASTYLNYHRHTLNAIYSNSSGVSVLTAQGLVPIPVGIPQPLLTNTVLYNAKSYGGGITTNFKRLFLTASFARANSQTGVLDSSSNNNSKLVNALVQYRVRKLYLMSGYTRFQQGIGATGLQPQTINSYYVGISRWFDVF